MSKIALMNKARQEKKDRIESTSFAQSYNLLNNQYNHLKGQYHELISQIEQPKKISYESENSILNDLILHDDKGRLEEYGSETLALCLHIRSISLEAYKILSEALPFPTPSKIEEEYKKITQDIPEKLTNIQYIGDIINMWKDSNKIRNNEVVDACLSVDALYFKPEAKITVENCVKGTAFTDELQSYFPKNCFEYFTKNPQSLQTFINLNWNKIIKAGFVFQIQPYQLKYDTFIVFIKATPNGKATEETVDMLNEIRRLSKNYRINIKSYAFDGDRAYKNIHVMFYESYVTSVIKKNAIVSKTKSSKLRMTSDFYHLIKRLRYRLLSCIVHAGFSIDTNQLDLDLIKQILSDLPNVVWNNESFTKMHDRLPIELFNIENFLKLFNEEEFNAAAYWFPISLSLIALDDDNVGFENREFLLECAFFFMIYYKKCLEDSEEITLLQQKGKENKDVTFYDNALLIEFSNTLYSHIQLMNIVEDYSFPRNSTTPLEHKFGFGRIKAKDVHTLSKFLQTISASQSIEDVRFKFDELKKIKNRCHKSITCEPKGEESIYINEDYSDPFDDMPYSPQCIAKYMLNMAGFDVDMYCEDVDGIPFWINEYFGKFCKDEINPRKFVTFNTGKLNTDQCPRIKSRMTGLPPGISRKKVNKYEYKEKLFLDICIEKFGHFPTKNNLLEALDIIKENDPDCPNPPTQKDSKETIYNWIVEHMNLYYLLLDSSNED